MLKRILAVLGFCFITQTAYAQTSQDNNDRLNQALTLYDQKSYHEAAKIFYELSQAKSGDKDLVQKAEFFLGKSLFNLDYYFGSLAWFQRIAEIGPDHNYYRANLKYLTDLAAVLPDDDAVVGLIGLYTLEDFPEKSKEDLSFFLGRYQYEQGLDFLDAGIALFQSVTPASSHYLDARFYEAISYVRLKDGPHALDALKEMLRYIAEVQVGNDYKTNRALRTKIDRYEQLVDLTMGRAFYTNHQFQTAIKYFDKIDPSSEFWLDALFGQTWSYFMLGRYDRSLGHIQTLNAPYFEAEFYPESLIVKSLTYFSNCRYSEAQAIESKFEEIYKPVEEELSSYLEKIDEVDHFYYLVEKFRKGKGGLEPRIQQLVVLVLSDKALLKKFQQIESLSQEEKKLKVDKQWGDAKVAIQLAQDLDDQKTSDIFETGTQIKVRFLRVKSELEELLRQGLKIQYESVNAEADAIDEELAKELSKSKDPITHPENTIEYYVDEEHNLWRFDREYWKDELGYYRSPISSVCKKEP